MEKSQLDENVQNDIRLIIGEFSRLYRYGINPNVKKKRICEAWEAHKLFIIGMKKRERNAKKV